MTIEILDLREMAKVNDGQVKVAPKAQENPRENSAVQAECPTSCQVEKLLPLQANIYASVTISKAVQEPHQANLARRANMFVASVKALITPSRLARTRASDSRS